MLLSDVDGDVAPFGKEGDDVESGFVGGGGIVVGVQLEDAETRGVGCCLPGEAAVVHDDGVCL